MRLRITLILILSVAFINISSGQNTNKKFTITGMVTDANQKPVEGAVIFIDKQKTSSLTDNKGLYRVRVSPKAKVITFFSFKNGAGEAAIDGRTIINFTLTGPGSSQIVNQNLEENVEEINVGYGSVKKKDLTAQIGKVNGQNPKYASYTNIYEMLRGEVPGVQIIGRSILIQGPSSINSGTEPLFVVDGMITSSIDEISPNMVKSIEILKGASASIYGSRGANGVILISLIGSERKK